MFDVLGHMMYMVTHAGKASYTTSVEDMPEDQTQRCVSQLDQRTLD